MTRYNTGNPLGSTDPRDLYDNAENLDAGINGTADTWRDRFGRDRKSWDGIESDFEQFLADGSTIEFPTWAEANSAAGSGQIPQNRQVAVIGDSGTHTDPVSGLTVPNSGRFLMVSAGLQFRSADVLSQKADKVAVPSVLPIADDVMVITDAEGNRSWMEAAMGTGSPTQRVGDELRPVLRIDEEIAEAVANRPDVVPIDGDVFRLTDAFGISSWIEAQLGTGRPTSNVGYAIANVIHLYAGPDQPPVWPGNFIIWTQLDSSLVPVQTYLVKG